jgi:hypothetical protein
LTTSTTEYNEYRRLLAAAVESGLNSEDITIEEIKFLQAKASGGDLSPELGNRLDELFK